MKKKSLKLTELVCCRTSLMYIPFYTIFSLKWLVISWLFSSIHKFQPTHAAFPISSLIMTGLIFSIFTLLLIRTLLIVTSLFWSICI